MPDDPRHMLVVAGPPGSGKSETFILGHIERGLSFSYETTLRTAITFDQAKLASLKNLPRAPKEFHYVQVFDNSDAVACGPRSMITACAPRAVIVASAGIGRR